MARKRENNPNWKGGRYVDSLGYIKINLGRDHPWATKNGYILEHRLVMAEHLGRKLKPGELVHHLNGIRDDNRIDNLMIVGGNGEHALFHRKHHERRMPNEPNPLLDCRCGCGQKFLKYDICGRPREYVSGHNPYPMPAQDEIIAILELGSMRVGRLIALIGKSRSSVQTTLWKLKKKGIVKQISHGVWSLRNES